MSADVARGHGGDGGGDDRPPPYQVLTGCGGCLDNRGKGNRKPNWVAGERGVALALPFLAPNATGVEGGGHGKDWEDGSYDLERIRRGRPSLIFEADWDAQLAFWNDPKNLARAAQNKQNREKSKMETSATREYPSLIHTFFLTHTVGGVFLNPEEKAIYDEMLRLQGLGFNTPTGVPYTEDEIMAIVRGGKHRGTFPVLDGFCQDRERSDGKFSQILTQLESQPEYGGGSGSVGCRDDEPGDDEDGDEDEEEEDDS
nr:hypothetical protein [Tanacetum cinerariifolium]